MSDRIGDGAAGLAGKAEQIAGQATGNERWVVEGKREQDAAREAAASGESAEDRDQEPAG
jgi:uncharacterized protein YjbJ (UPF0337 family)